MEGTWHIKARRQKYMEKYFMKSGKLSEVEQDPVGALGLRNLSVSSVSCLGFSL